MSECLEHSSLLEMFLKHQIPEHACQVLAAFIKRHPHEGLNLILEILSKFDGLKHMGLCAVLVDIGLKSELGFIFRAQLENNWKTFDPKLRLHLTLACHHPSAVPSEIAEAWFDHVSTSNEEKQTILSGLYGNWERRNCGPLILSLASKVGPLGPGFEEGH